MTELRKTRTAAAAIAAYRIVTHGAADNQVVQASDPTQPLYGVVEELGAKAAGHPVDVTLSGRPKVTYGGIVTHGDPLTTDADGRAVKAAPAAGANVRIIGFAEVSGIAGDVVEFQFAPGVMQG